MSPLWWILAVLGAAAVLYVALSVYLGVVLKWEDEQTVGLGYYGRPRAERQRFKRTLRRHALVLSPILRLSARLGRLDFRKARIRYQGYSAPSGSCSVESFAAAAAYRPRPEDVFVVTQMKCGTTWMQHLVYQILHRGAGHLVESDTTLYAVSPWLEGRKSVPLAQAPLLGRERPTRIIKTHLPAQLCPFSREAKYIYVVRHPVSCFASCIDFVETNVGAMAPGLPAFEEWFCSDDLMWWGTWTNHVAGWWDRSVAESNVLFLYFEDLKRDLGGCTRRVAEFLGVAPLDQAELARVVEKCGFQYMQEHQDSFEMHPPHILQTNAEMFVSGAAERHLDVPEDARERVRRWAAAGLAGSTFPLATAYPDVAAAVDPARPLVRD